jgi:6-pyruvoyltetrahydropterin/6-carboxytetrahydropterin synthase
VTELFREFTFEAAHRLPHIPEGQRCGRLHGHSYRVEVHVGGEVDRPRAGVGLRRHQRGRAPVRDRLDHYYLSDIDGLADPTSETQARWIWDRLTNVLPLTRVVVRETCTSGVEYRGPTEEKERTARE